jgi:Ca2+-binding EF-hand superfamily protein
MRIILLAGAAVLALAATTAQAQAPDPAAIFAQFDTNKDGGISKEEFVAAGRPEARFAAVDANGDGKIDQAELTTAIQRMQQSGG